MIFKGEFPIDRLMLSQIKNPDEADRYIQYASTNAARKLGQVICEKIPFKKDELKSCREELIHDSVYPFMFAPPDLRSDYYRCELFVTSTEDLDKLLKDLKEALRFADPLIESLVASAINSFLEK